jgi:hypothetical protein
MPIDDLPPEQELQHHTYRTSVIPWYVRGIWLLFWIFVVYYSVTYFLPALQSESFLTK